jgi:hypothetical protein
MDPIKTIDMLTLSRHAAQMADKIGLKCAESLVTLTHQLAEKHAEHGIKVIGYYGSIVPVQRFRGSKPQPLSA